MKNISKFIFLFLCITHLITFISCNNDMDDSKPEEPDYGFSNFDYTTYYGYDEYNNYDVPPWAIKLILSAEEI